MEQWLLFAVAILLVGAVQLLALYRAQNGWGERELRANAEAAPPMGVEMETPDRDAASDRDSGGESGPGRGDDTQLCPRCGAPNEAGYTYCRECLGYLETTDSGHPGI